MAESWFWVNNVNSFKILYDCNFSKYFEEKVNEQEKYPKFMSTTQILTKWL